VERLQILWVTRSRLAPGAGVKPHSHPYYHMFHIAGGTFQFSVEGNNYTLRSGSTLLVPPHMEHGYTNVTDQTGSYLEIKFALPQSAPEEAVMRLTDDPLAQLLFQRILKEFSELGRIADEAAAAYLKALLEVLDQDRRYKKPPQPFRYVDASGCSHLSQQIILHLEAHYSEALSLDDLAGAMGYNKSYLCVAFKKDTHQTILDCLNMIRIRNAAELIVYSELSLAQVAQMCGFSSVSHFNRVFLKYAGITPGQCRRAYPAGILFGFGRTPAQLSAPSDHFMYSVLAQKRISLDMIAALDRKDTQEDQ